MINTFRNKILIVEDDQGISTFLRAALTSNDYDVILASNGNSALNIISSHCPDCILLDLGLPDIEGNQVIKRVRRWTSIPIIVISARNMEDDKVQALDLGADDYISKPFGTKELLARIRTALRHRQTVSDNDEIAIKGTFHVGDMEIDYRKHCVYVAGENVHLTPNEFKIVALLGMHAGQVMTYKSILQELWGPSNNTDNKILRVHMASIRRKIEPNPSEPRYIFTEVGVGYRMAEDEKPSSSSVNYGQG